MSLSSSLPVRRRARVAFAAGLAVAGLALAAAPATALATPAASARTAAAATAASTDWPGYGGGASRDGLAAATPAPHGLRTGWRAGLDGAVYAEPVVIGSTVVVATENDSVYGFDRYDGRLRWYRHLAVPVEPGALPCGDIGPSGITGTPVASAALGRVWVVTFSRTAADGYQHLLWGLSLATGRTVTRQGVDGPGSDPRSQQERGALDLVGNRVYVPFGGLYGDCSDYHGWVIGAPVSGRGALATYVTPTQREAGIWAPAGVMSSGSRIYVATGNGSPANTIDNSDSVLRLALTTTGRLAVRSSFTPANYAELSATDTDLGSTAPVMLPANRVWMIGKQGVGYVLGANHLGGVGRAIASTQVCSGAAGASAVDGTEIVVSCYGGLTAVREEVGAAGTSLRVLWSASTHSGPPTIAGGVVWSVTGGGSGHLYGYDLRTGRLRYAFATGDVQTSFPGVAASGGRLYVPEGAELVTYANA